MHSFAKKLDDILNTTGEKTYLSVVSIAQNIRRLICIFMHLLQIDVLLMPALLLSILSITPTA